MKISDLNIWVNFYSTLNYSKGKMLTIFSENEENKKEVQENKKKFYSNFSIFTLFLVSTFVISNYTTEINRELNIV
jgi:hypothetical protein